MSWRNIAPDIQIFSDYVIIEKQKVMRPVNFATSHWLAFWERMKGDE